MSHSISLASNAHLALIKFHRYRSLPEYQQELLMNELKRRKLNSLEIAALASETEAFALYDIHVLACTRCQQKKINRIQAQKLGLIDFYKDEIHCIFCNTIIKNKKRSDSILKSLFSFLLKPFLKLKS